MVNKKHILLFSILLILVSAVFISGKKTSPADTPGPVNFVANPDLYYNITHLYDSGKSEIIASRFRDLNRKGIFNGTILYAEQGRVVYEDAIGIADFRTGDPLETESQFQLASVSKMFASMAIMILHEDGKLDYDDPVGKFIPEFPYPEITLRQLLTHRSGLSNYMSLTDQHWNKQRPISNEQMIALFAKHKPVSYFKPDKGFHYCNTNYALLASVVERISGVHFDEFIDQRIFKPLEMNHSFVYNLRNDSLVSDRVDAGVPGYKSRGRHAQRYPDDYLNGVMGDKGVYSTVGDLFKFSRALDQGTLIPVESLREAFKPGSPKFNRRHDNYGFGWRTRGDMDSTVYHFGWWKGFRTYFARDMKNERVLIVLSNIQHASVSEVLWDIMKDEEEKEELFAIYQSLK